MTVFALFQPQQEIYYWLISSIVFPNKMTGVPYEKIKP